jgi:fructose-specific phosphotransferase system IIC component
VSEPELYGLLAEFISADQLVDAVTRAHLEPHLATVEAYSPFPIEGLAAAAGLRTDRVAPAVLLGAVVGGVGTYALEWYSAVFDYPLNIGGRPFASWPAFLPPAIEMTVLGAALAGVIAMLIGNGLPRLHHPLFGVPAFERASNDRFFLLLRAQGMAFDPDRARSFLESLAPLAISEVRS